MFTETLQMGIVVRDPDEAVRAVHVNPDLDAVCPPAR
jgi:hypothetical protein